MCGHVGVIGMGIIDADLKVLRELSQCIVVRGTDGAGILQGAVFTKSQHYVVEKTGNEMSYLMWFHKTQKGGDRWLFDNPNDNFYCVHTRAATRGGITKANAHPFEFNNIVGMHNGTLKDAKYDPKMTGKTDSELMFGDMNDRGMLPVLQEMDRDSAYAIVMFDKKKRKFFIARNKERPLFVAWNKNRRVLYYASEHGLLDWVLGRNGIKYDLIRYFKEEAVYSFDPYDVNVNRAPDWKVVDIFPTVEAEKPVEKTKTFEEVIEKKAYTPAPPIIQNNKKFTEFNIPHQQQPKVTVLHAQKKDNAPDPLPEQQKAKEKDQAAATFGKTSKTQSGQGSNRTVVPRNSLHKSCTGCGKDMDLLDQHEGCEIKTDMYLCKKCDELMTDTKRSRFLM